MSEHKKRSALYCALEEDRGIFRAGVIEATLTLAPMRKRSTRGDLIVAGFIDGAEIEVVFPGRRSEHAGPLLAAMSRPGKSSRASDGGAITIRARGAWRSRIVCKDDIVTSRIYQFLAAEWSLLDAPDGRFHGEPPQS